MTSLIKKNLETFPAVFGWGAFDKIFNNTFDEFFENSPGYPTDLIEIKNDKGDIVGYEINVTLAGIPRENIEISTEKDTISIIVKKTESDSKNKNYIKRGISQRSMQLRYGLHSIDTEKIKASLDNGLLKINLPLLEEKKIRTINID